MADLIAGRAIEGVRPLLQRLGQPDKSHLGWVAGAALACPLIAHTAHAIVSGGGTQTVCCKILRMDERDETVKQTARRLRAANVAQSKARDEHVAAVLAALRDGRPPMTIADLSPLTASRLRQIARDEGIPAATKGHHSPSS